MWSDEYACLDRRRCLSESGQDQVVKFALKRQFEVVLVAGQAVPRPAYALVKLIVVPSGPDAADDYLVEHAVPGSW